MTQFQHTTIEQTKTWLEAGDITLVDIRDPAAYQASHIDGATHITNTNVQEFIRAADLDKPLVVYCYHGNASQGAAQFFYEQGFEQVYSMDGGFEAWRCRYIG